MGCNSSTPETQVSVLDHKAAQLQLPNPTSQSNHKKGRTSLAVPEVESPEEEANDAGRRNRKSSRTERYPKNTLSEIQERRPHTKGRVVGLNPSKNPPPKRRLTRTGSFTSMKVDGALTSGDVVNDETTLSSLSVMSTRKLQASDVTSFMDGLPTHGDDSGSGDETTTSRPRKRKSSSKKTQRRKHRESVEDEGWNESASEKKQNVHECINPLSEHKHKHKHGKKEQQQEQEPKEEQPSNNNHQNDNRRSRRESSISSTGSLIIGTRDTETDDQENIVPLLTRKRRARRSIFKRVADIVSRVRGASIDEDDGTQRTQRNRSSVTSSSEWQSNRQPRLSEDEPEADPSIRGVRNAAKTSSLSLLRQTMSSGSIDKNGSKASSLSPVRRTMSSDEQPTSVSELGADEARDAAMRELFEGKLKLMRQFYSWDQVPMDFFVDRHVSIRNVTSEKKKFREEESSDEQRSSRDLSNTSKRGVRGRLSASLAAHRASVGDNRGSFARERANSIAASQRRSSRLSESKSSTRRLNRKQ